MEYEIHLFVFFRVVQIDFLRNGRIRFQSHLQVDADARVLFELFLDGLGHERVVLAVDHAAAPAAVNGQNVSAVAGHAAAPAAAGGKRTDA